MVSSINSSIGLSSMATAQARVDNPFDKLDQNGDGTLDASEISAMAEEITEMTSQAVDTDELLAQLDSDEDGLISEAEFEENRPLGPPPGPPPGMMTGSGTSENGGGVQSLLDALGSSDEDDDGTSLTDALDTNGDGVVDAEEAMAGANLLMQRYQAQLDLLFQQQGESGGIDYNFFA